MFIVQATGPELYKMFLSIKHANLFLNIFEQGSIFFKILLHLFLTYNMAFSDQSLAVLS
jgi:hypothetical protein